MLTKRFRNKSYHLMMNYLYICPKIIEYVKTNMNMSKIGTLIPAGGKPKAHQGLLKNPMSFYYEISTTMSQNS